MMKPPVSARSLSFTPYMFVMLTSLPMLTLVSSTAFLRWHCSRCQPQGILEMQSAITHHKEILQTRRRHQCLVGLVELSKDLAVWVPTEAGQMPSTFAPYLSGTYLRMTFLPRPTTASPAMRSRCRSLSFWYRLQETTQGSGLRPESGTCSNPRTRRCYAASTSREPTASSRAHGYSVSTTLSTLRRGDQVTICSFLTY